MAKAKTSTKKQPKKLSRFNFSKSQMIVAAVFILGFGVFGVYKLAFSGAYTPAVNSNCKSKVLQRGSQGKCVAAAQTMLALQGFGNKYGADGKFGPNTKRNVVSFQNANGLGRGDGKIGPKTWSKLCGKDYSKVVRLLKQTGEVDLQYKLSSARNLVCN